jgi:hypothetical protein
MQELVDASGPSGAALVFFQLAAALIAIVEQSESRIADRDISPPILIDQSKSVIRAKRVSGKFTKTVQGKCDLRFPLWDFCFILAYHFLLSFSHFLSLFSVP